MLGNDVVEFWLCEFWFVGLVVSMTTVADHVYKDVFVEFLTELSRQSCSKYYRLRIVSIHVNNWGINYLCHIRTVDGGSCVVKVSRESHLIVDHKVDGTSGVVAF